MENGLLLVSEVDVTAFHLMYEMKERLYGFVYALFAFKTSGRTDCHPDVMAGSAPMLWV
jgi:hypothetical protein